MPTELLMLIGAGGHASVVFEALCASGAQAHVQLRDDSPREPSPGFAGLPVSNPAVPTQVSTSSRAHVAVGNNEARRRLCSEFAARGVQLVTVVHPRAAVAHTAHIADGVFLAAQCVVGPLARLGTGVILNHGAVVDHDCEVGEFTHIAPGAILGGGVQVGSDVLIGAGAVLLPGVKVGNGATVGAGSVVTRDVSGGVVVGVPARPVGGRKSI
jgi:sugar O-acyltransferase (sialic acid O-acetyltransferase NeuD family)